MNHQNVRVSECVACRDFPCVDVTHEGYVVPEIEIAPEEVSLITISEAAPAERGDYYYAGGKPLFEQTTVEAFANDGQAHHREAIERLRRIAGRAWGDGFIAQRYAEETREPQRTPSVRLCAVSVLS